MDRLAIASGQTPTLRLRIRAKAILQRAIGSAQWLRPHRLRRRRLDASRIATRAPRPPVSRSCCRTAATVCCSGFAKILAKNHRTPHPRSTPPHPLPPPPPSNPLCCCCRRIPQTPRVLTSLDHSPDPEVTHGNTDNRWSGSPGFSWMISVFLFLAKSVRLCIRVV